MKLKTNITTVGNGKGILIPSKFVYSDGSEMLKGDLVIVTVEKVSALESKLRSLNCEVSDE